MNTIITILGLIAIGYVGVEVATAVYIYRNRRTLVPRIFAALRTNLGITELGNQIYRHDDTAAARFDRLERKINYIGNHTKFEREQLRAMGVLPELTRTTSGPPNLELARDPGQTFQINPLKRN